MRDISTKADNDPTSAGLLTAEEFNSHATEVENVVKPFMGLDALDTKQMAKAIDISSKANFYNDIGSQNAVHLVRGATSEQLETLFDGMMVYFTPANTNTGASTLKVNGLQAFPLVFNGGNLAAGVLSVGALYCAIYDATAQKFELKATGGNPSEYVKYSAGAVRDAQGNLVAYNQLHFPSGAGWQKMPSGLIWQWGTANAGASNSGIRTNLPISFPNTGLGVVATHNGGGADTSAITAVSLENGNKVYIATRHPVVISANYWAWGY